MKVISLPSFLGDKMWEINSGFQILSFLYAFLLGILFSVFYDFFKVTRKVFNLSDLIIFIEDIIYFLIISFVTFLFLISTTNGKLRIYVFLSVSLGFYIWKISLSKYLCNLSTFILKNINKLLKAIRNRFYCIFSRFEAGILKIYKKTPYFIINIKNSFKKLLKRDKDLLYTKQE